MKQTITTIGCLVFVIIGLAIVIADGNDKAYKEGHRAGKQDGIKCEKQRRTAWIDSIRNNNTWNNGVPNSIRKDFK